MPQDRNPKVGVEFNFRVGTANWRDTVINNLKARNRAGTTINEIVESAFGGLDAKNTCVVNARSTVIEILNELCEIGVVAKKGLRYHWWKYAA